MFDVEDVAPFAGFGVFVEDVQCCHYVVLDDVNQNIIVPHICIVSFHVISVLLGQHVVQSPVVEI